MDSLEEYECRQIVLVSPANSSLTWNMPMSLLESAALRKDEEATPWPVLAIDSNMTSVKEIISIEFIVRVKDSIRPG